MITCADSPDMTDAPLLAILMRLSPSPFDHGIAWSSPPVPAAAGSTAMLTPGP
jgi:hypothetical protein